MYNVNSLFAGLFYAYQTYFEYVRRYGGGEVLIGTAHART